MRTDLTEGKNSIRRPWARPMQLTFREEEEEKVKRSDRHSDSVTSNKTRKVIQGE